MALVVGAEIPASTENRIQVAVGETADGMPIVDHAQLDAAIDYLNSEIKQGRPVAVGVTYRAGGPNRDGITDHYVLAYERVTENDYRCHDPGRRTGAGTLLSKTPRGNLSASVTAGLRRAEMAMVVRNA